MTERIEGLSIGLNLDTLKLDSGLTDVKSKMSLLNSELKRNMSAFDRGEKSISKYETQLSGLNKKIEAQRAVTESAKKTYEKMVDEYGEGSKEADQAATAYNNQAASLQNLERYVDGVTQEMKEFVEQQRIAESGWGKLGTAMEATGGKLTAVGDKMKGAGKSLSMYVTAPLVGFGVLAAKTGIDFDDSMAKVQAISGATGDDLTKLRNKAKDMGRTTKFSASESAEALNYMALAGWKTEEMVDGLDGVMALAAASGEDLASVSDIVTDGLSAFGLKAKESGRMADVLAAASANANTDVAGLGAAFQYVAPVAGALGFTIEDTSKAIGLMSNAGIKGEKAGTALRTMMTNLAKPTKAMKDQMNKLGLSLTDSKGNMKSFDEIMLDIRGSFKNLTEEQQASAAATIFGKEAMSGALAIVGASEVDYKKLSKAIGESEGAAKKMSDIMEGKLGGTIREIKSGLEGFAISIYEGMLPALEKGADKTLQFVGWINKLSPAVKTSGLVIAALAASIGPVLLAFGTFISIIGSAMTTLAPLMTSIAKAGGLLGYLKTAMLALSGPVGITIGVVAALSIGFTLLYKKSETFRNIIGLLVEKLKELGGKVLESLRSAIGSVVSFFRSQGKVLQDFWRENGAVITKAATNIGTVVGGAFKGILSVIKFVMPFVLSIIKSVWSNIQGVISGALKIIMGLVQVFSGLFTGNFSKMWSGIKNIFFGALQLIWNYVQLMLWGKLLKGILSLGKLLLKAFRNTWTSIQTSVINTVIKLVSGIRSRFTAMRNTVSDIFRSTKEKVSGFVVDMIRTVKNMPGKMADGIRNAGGKVKEAMTGLGNKMIKGLGKGVNGVIKGVNWVLGKFGLTKIGEWSVPQYAHGTGGHPGGLAVVGDGKGSNAGKELVATPDGQAYLSPAKPSLVNLPKGTHVLSATDTRSILGDIPKYAWGTKIKKGAAKVKEKLFDAWEYISKPSKLLDIAMDKLGINKPDNSNLMGRIARGGFNLIKTKAIDFVKSKLSSLDAGPGGFSFWSPFRRTSDYGMRWGRLHKGVDWAAPSGTPIPAQAGGTVVSAGFGRRGSGFGGYGNYVLVKGANGLSYLYAHNSRNNVAVGDTVSKGQTIGLVGNTGDSKGAHVHFEVRRNGQAINPDSLGGNASGNVKSWIKAGMARAGVSGANWINGLGYIIQKESSGNPRAVGAMTSSGTAKGLMQLKDFNISGNAFDPINNIFHGIKYIKGRYGSIGKALSFWKRNNWYATGGLVNDGIYRLGEEGYPEWIIPTDPARRTDAMKLLALAGKDIGNKRPGQLPNVPSNTDDPLLKQLLAATVEQNEILKQLLAKNPDLYMDKDKVGRAVEPAVTKQQQRKTHRGRRAPGFA